MSEKSSDSRPPSQPSALLLMSNADFGGLVAGTGPSLLPALSRTEGSTHHLLSSDDDAEADSFIGQAPSPDHRQPSPFSMFQHQATGHDPFTEVKQPKPEDFASVRPVQFSTPTSGQQGTRTVIPGPVPLPQFTQLPSSRQTTSSLASTVAPPAATSAPTNLFRMSGKPQYVAPPSQTSYQEPHSLHQPGYSSGPSSSSGVPEPPRAAFPPGPPGATLPPQSGLPPGPPASGVPVPHQLGFTPRPRLQSSHHQMSGFLPRPFESDALSSSVNSAPVQTEAYPLDSGIEMRSYQIHPPVGLPASGQAYHPVQSHWFHRVIIEGKEVWQPFSLFDNKRLEEALKKGLSVGHLVSVEGGRYEVNVKQRLQTAIYWREEASPVRRCSWFFRPEGENRFLPYDEEFAAELEENYKRTVLTSDFHKRLIFPGGETIVIHNPQVIVQFHAQPDAYGNTSTESRPIVLKRGFVDLSKLPEDESLQIDHLVLVVQGISSTCGLRYRSTIDCVNSFRAIASEMMKSHFKQAVDERRVGRIEFLPVLWHEAMHGHVTGLDRKLKSITLSSVGKLRNFSNDQLLDVLIYRSPAYAQDIMTTVGNELNHLVQLFKSRNPSFTGGTSVAGHGLGGQILFDILLNQSSSTLLDDSFKTETVERNSSISASVPVKDKEAVNGETTKSTDHAETVAETLESILELLGLSMYLDNFKRELIDLNALSLCEDSDIKEMGIPLGPRKKLQGFLKDYKDHQQKRKLEAEQKALQMAILKEQEEAKKLEQAAALAVKDPLLPGGNNTSIEYSVGKTGIGCPFVKYPDLTFDPENLFALGSSIAMFLALKGTELLGEEFLLPTCPGFFNIFHPFDPLAYRMEPLIVPAYPAKPVQIPHHKGRKRLHLELKESLTRIGYDLKQRIIDSVKSTWKTINNFALGNKVTPPAQDEVEREVDTVISEMTRDVDDSSSVVASSVADEDDIPVGSLNQGRRVDFVLQEKPIEIFNDYMFALGSYSCYWESEDTVLMMLKEIYLLMGIIANKAGAADAAANLSTQASSASFGPPPRTGFIQPPAATSLGSSNPLLPVASATPSQLSSPPPSSMQGMPPPGPPPASVGVPSAQKPLQPPSAAPAFAPPPLSGFVKK